MRGHLHRVDMDTKRLDNGLFCFKKKKKKKKAHMYSKAKVAAKDLYVGCGPDPYY